MSYAPPKRRSSSALVQNWLIENEITFTVEIAGNGDDKIKIMGSDGIPRILCVSRGIAGARSQNNSLARIKRICRQCKDNGMRGQQRQSPSLHQP